jgi:cell division protein FtsQ
MSHKFLVKGLVSILLMSVVGTGLYMMEDLTDQRANIMLRSALTDTQRAEVLGKLRQSDIDLTSLEEVKANLTKIDWIHRVYIAKRWPNDLELDIRVQQAIAYWNDNGFINLEGEVFETDHIIGGDLPQLYGPSGSAQKVMNEYQQLNQVLFKTGRAIEVLTLNNRGAWEFQDFFGIKVLLGKENIRQRLQRSIAVLQAIAQTEQRGKPIRVDARYNNGVSVEWQEKKLALAKTFKLQRDVSL